MPEWQFLDTLSTLKGDVYQGWDDEYTQFRINIIKAILHMTNIISMNTKDSENLSQTAFQIAYD